MCSCSFQLVDLHPPLFIASECNLIPPKNKGSDYPLEPLMWLFSLLMLPHLSLQLAFPRLTHILICCAILLLALSLSTGHIKGCQVTISSASYVVTRAHGRDRSVP